MPRKAGDRRRLEQAANRQLDAEREPNARHDSGRKKRVSTALEEVVANADRRGAEDLGEHGGKAGLGFRPWRLDSSVLAWFRSSRSGKPLPIDLAARGARQRVERHVARRHHGRRKLAGELVAQLPHVDVTSCDEVRAQIPGAIGVVAIDDGYVAHAWTRPQRVL